MKRVIGLDLSLTSTGMALVEWGKLVELANTGMAGKKAWTVTQSSKRIQSIVNDVLLFVARPIPPDLVVIESPSFGSTGGSAHERAGLWWQVVALCDKLDIPVATVAPTTRAKYITGDGRCKDKKVVMAFAIESYVTEDSPRITNDDQADAAGLAAMGARWLGEPIEVRPLPDRNLEAMRGAKWPT